MTRRIFTMLVALFMMTSVVFVVFPTNPASAENGMEYDETWIRISTLEDFSNVGSDENVGGIIFASNGKYVQINDIIFDRDLNGGFDVVLKVSLSGNEVTVTVEYVDGEIIETSICSINVNGTRILTNPAIFTINDITAPLIVTAGGTALGVHEELDEENSDFAIASTFRFTGDEVKSVIANSNGNMDPLSPNGDFSGTYDGNGYKIMGLKTAVISTSDAFSGMFGSVVSAALKNVSLEDNSSIATYGTNVHAGSLIGHATGDVVLTNCYTIGDVYSTTQLNAFTGGLVGESLKGNVIMTDCYTEGNISSLYGALFTGGLVGRVGGDVVAENCYSTGDIASLSTTNYGTTYTGGLVGRANGNASISNSYTIGDTTSSSAYLYSGGLIGFVNTSDVTNCYTTGIITATAKRTQLYSGGLIGTAYNSMTATNCYTLSTIAASGTTILKGAVVGDIRGVGYVTNCYFLAQDGFGLNGNGTPIIDGNEFRTTGGSGALTAEQLRDSNSYHASVTIIDPDIEFEGWDFENIWYIDEDSNTDPIKRFNQGFPSLTAEDVPEEVIPPEEIPDETPEKMPGGDVSDEECIHPEDPVNDDRRTWMFIFLIVIVSILVISLGRPTN